jgi:pimeloyl-ACP methyl ester carboxylesterase
MSVDAKRDRLSWQLARKEYPLSNKQRRTIMACWFLVLCLAMAETYGQTEGLLRRNLPALNLGGWSDQVVFRDWRIQRHAVIGHHRLADPQGHRQAFGSYDACLDALAKAKEDHHLEPLPPHVVLVLHGHGATPRFMQGLSNHLIDQGGLHVENIGYASTLENIPSFAKSLDNIIRHLPGVQKIDFVAHSMGGIVIRRYLGDLKRSMPAMRSQITFGRFVMISPPNHGAEIADVVADLVADREIIRTAAEFLAGETAQELAPSRGWPELEKTLVVPDFEFAIIAGGRGDDSGYLSQLPGDDDGLLTVDTMKLAGANDFIQVKGLHMLMPRYKEVQELTLNYLKHGYFRSFELRQPLK